MARSVSYTTLDELIVSHFSLTAHCCNSMCQHSNDLDLMDLAWKLGPYHSCGADGLELKLRCTRCGGRQVSIKVNPQFMENRRRGLY